MIIHECRQGTDEWLQLRLGKVTASNFAKAIGKEQGETRKKLMYKLGAERVTGEIESGYKNSAMEWGNETEDAAREYYELRNDVSVRQVGFVELNDDIGVSPDGLVGEDGLIEIKCPLSSTHFKYVVEKRFPSTYKAQVQGQLWVTDRKWCDFVSYDPRNKSKPFWSIRVERDDKYIAELSAKIDNFVMEMKRLTDIITEQPF